MHSSNVLTHRQRQCPAWPPQESQQRTAPSARRHVRCPGHHVNHHQLHLYTCTHRCEHVLDVVAAVHKQHAQCQLRWDDPRLAPTNPRHKHRVDNGGPQQLEAERVGGKGECAELGVAEDMLEQEGQGAKDKAQWDACID